MKYKIKILKLLWAVLIFISLGMIKPVYAAEDGTVLAISDIYTRQDENFTTTLYIAENADICDFQISLNYDPELITLVSAEAVNDTGTLQINRNTEGLMHLVFSSSSNIVEKTDLIELTFHVDANAGIGAYDCITVDNSYANMASSLDETTGAFETVELITDFVPLILYEMGDVNLDMSVSVRDVSILKRHLTYLATIPELSDFHLQIADAEKDDKVNMRDVARIMRRCAYYLDDIYGDRINIYFYDVDGNQYAVKSVIYGGDLIKLPTVPYRENYGEGLWSASTGSYVEPDLTGIEKEISLYAVYGEYQSEAMAYYKQKLTESYYSGDLPTGLSSDLNLVTTLNYQSGYYAEIFWQSSYSYIMNSTTGKFNQPTYPTELTLTAKIVSYDSNNAIEAQDEIIFVYQVPGIYITPTKKEIATWIQNFFTDDDGGYKINYNLKLPHKVTNEQVIGTGSNKYEVRVNWLYLDSDGNEQPITEISRTTSAQEMDLIAVITFNGEPLEDDGRIYLDDVQITAIDQIEVKNYIIEQIAANMGTTLTDGETMWSNDLKYGTTVKWISAQQDMATIANNVVTIDESAVNGALLPLTVRVSYTTNGELQEFELSYTVSVVTDNSLLVPGTNITQELYDALKEQLLETTGFTGSLTTGALRDQKFVSLDLSDYPEITSLQGLSYCTNLRALDISNLKIQDSSMNEIAALPKLEALIAKNCGLDNLSDGGAAVLKNSINLKLLDLSDNNFTTLDSVLDPDVNYGRLRQVYLANNQLEDISALSRASALTYLSLADNGLTTEDIAQLANFPYLTYLSLANNQIDDIEVLQNLTHLTELRLQHNQLTDVRNLRKLTNLQALYLGHNNINSGVEFLKTLTSLEVLYLNDNKISSISDLSTLTKLVAINVTNNPELDDLSVLTNSKGTLEEIYAENNNLTSFNFIEGMFNLRVLMLSGNALEDATQNDFLTTQLSGLTNMQVLTLSGKPLKDLNFLVYMPNLIRLDVAGCGLSATDSEGTSNISSIVNRYSTLKVLDISNNDMTGSEEELLNLKNLSNMVIFYADNVCDGIDMYALVNEMPQLRYISMENCGITDLSWMAKKQNLTYVDLADNNVANVDLSVQINTRSLETLEYLYLDTNVAATFIDFYEVGIDNVLKELSLRNITIESISHLPDMNSLIYLDLGNTGLTNLQGEDPDFYEVHSIERFEQLETLNVSGLQVELAPLLNLPNLNTIYAVAKPSDQMFYKNNLHTLQSLYNKSVTNYLYDSVTSYVPTAQTEGDAILNLIEDFSCTITVAADGIMSDNNPVLPATINDYVIDWTISNETNYEIVDNKLAVKSYEDIRNETLTLTAAILVYDDQEIVTRDFTIDVNILRPSKDSRSLYYLVDTTGYGEELQRNDTFVYDIGLQAAATEGFSEPVKPVVDEIIYSYSSVLESGSTTPYPNVIEEKENHSYVVLEGAPLNSVTTITVELVHYMNGETVVDDVVTTEFAVKERSYTITYVTNEGTITDANGLVVTSQKKGEESLLFTDITIVRTGYLFDGWYSDAALTQLYWAEGSDPVYMPAKDVTVYAKWTPHAFNLNFHANGGTVSETTRLVLCDQPFGELPVPTRDYYTFVGWYTSAEGGTEITADTSMETADDITVYAQWNLNSVSDWVLASEMPSDAQIVNSKWTYTLTTTTESTNTSLSGYTQTGSYWVQSGSGSVKYSTAFPSGFDTSHSIYTSFNKSALSSYENTTNKRVVSNSWAGYVYWHWMYDTNYANGTSGRAIYNKYGTGPDNGYVYKYFGAFTSSNGSYSSSTGYCNSLGIRNYIVPERTAWADCQGATRWFRFDYYTSNYTDYYKMFQYQKVENKESTTEVTASSSISNVQKWVQYRSK